VLRSEYNVNSEPGKVQPQDPVEMLRGLGYSEEQIRKLMKQGAFPVTGPTRVTPIPEPRYPPVEDRPIKEPPWFRKKPEPDSTTTSGPGHSSPLTAHDLVRPVLEPISQAIDLTITQYREGVMGGEESITDRFLGVITDKLNDFQDQGVTWRAQTFRSKGPGAPETRIGADFAAVLILDLPSVSVKLLTGFLAQAKLLEPDRTLSRREYERLREQCVLMLQITPAAYVFLYSSTCVSVVPAIAVLHSEQRNPYLLFETPCLHFFDNYFRGLLGDHRLLEWTGSGFQSFLADGVARKVIAFLGKNKSSQDLRQQNAADPGG
jgi:hypothetical protein